MDLLNDYIADRGKKSFSVSNFFKKKTDLIQTYCNQLEPDNEELDLKQFWTTQIDLFAAQHKDMRFTKDYYLIDFTDFQIKRIKHLDNNRIKKNVSLTRMRAVNDLLKDDVFQGKSTSITNLAIIDSLNTSQRSLSHVSEMHKKDLLYYHIIDLVTSSKKQSIHKALNAAQFEEFSKFHRSKFTNLKDIASYTKSIMELCKASSSKQALKETKKAISLLTSISLKTERLTVYKIVKVFAATILDDGNKLNGAYNEVEYTFFFLFPIIKQALHSIPVVFKLGESHLQCAIKQTNDDEAADAGPKIDIIMSHKQNSLAMSVVEVSGPNHKVNKNHYIGDRNKIAKNLKSIIKTIEKASSTPDIQALKKIKVYGLQVYLGKIYVYSMSKITGSYYLLVLEKTIDIPCSSGLLYQQLPGFLASFLYLANIYSESIASIDKFFDDSNKHNIPSYLNSEASTPNVSPKKPKQIQSNQ